MIVALVALVCGVAVLVAGPVPRRTTPALLDRGVLDVRSVRPFVAGMYIAAVLVVLGLVAGSPLLAGPAAVCAGVAGRLVEPMAARRREARRRAQVTDLVDSITRSVRSGATLAGALGEVQRDVVAPDLAAELDGVRAQVDAGRPLPSVLDNWSRSTSDPDLRLLAGTVAVLAAAGGSAGPALDAAARTIRARTAAAAEVQALAAQARASAAVLVLAPAVFAAVLAAVDPRLGHFLLNDPGGALCVSVGLGLDGLGLWWMQRIIDGGGR